MFKYLKVVFKVIFPIIGAYFSWIISYSRHPEKYSLELRFSKVQTLILKIFKAFNVKIHDEEFLEYYNHISSNENHLFVCNHISDLDPLIFIACAKKPVTFVAKIETKKYPLVGRVIKILDGEFMDRDNLKQSLKVMNSIQKKLDSDKKLDIMIFPEGTRNKTNIYKTLCYHHGTFRPAYKSKKGILAFAITGDQKVLSFKDNSKKFDVYIKKVLEFNENDYLDKKTTDLALLTETKTNIVLQEFKNKLSS